MAKFIKVKSISNYHVFKIKDINIISPKTEHYDNNKSVIILKTYNRELYSTETPEEIYNKIEQIKNK